MDKGVILMKKNLFLILTVVIFSLMLPVFAFSMEYLHKLEVQNMQFSWIVEGDKIHVKLSAKTTVINPESNNRKLYKKIIENCFANF